MFTCLDGCQVKNVLDHKWKTGPVPRLADPYTTLQNRAGILSAPSAAADDVRGAATG